MTGNRTLTALRQRLQHLESMCEGQRQIVSHHSQQVTLHEAMHTRALASDALIREQIDACKEEIQRVETLEREREEATQETPPAQRADNSSHTQALMCDA